MSKNIPVMLVDVLVIVDLDSSGSRDRPEADSDQKEPNKKLGPRRPGPDVYEAPQEKSHASNNDHADAMSQTPEPTDPTGPRGVLDGDGCQGGQMVRT